MADENKRTVTTEEYERGIGYIQNDVDSNTYAIRDLEENSININNWKNYIYYNGAFSTATTYTYNNLVLWQKIDRYGGYCIESTIIYTFIFSSDTNLNTGGARLKFGSPRNGSYYTGPLFQKGLYLMIYSDGGSNGTAFSLESNGSNISVGYNGSAFTFIGGEKYEIRMKYCYNPTTDTTTLTNI